MVTNCRGNPPWLPILRAATGGRPYKFLFGSGYAGFGNYKNPFCFKGRRFVQINTEKHFWFDKILKICVHLRPNNLIFLIEPMLGAGNNIVLYVFPEVREVSTIPGHTHH